MKKLMPSGQKVPKLRGRKVLPSSKEDLIERRRLFLEEFFSKALMGSYTHHSDYACQCVETVQPAISSISIECVAKFDLSALPAVLLTGDTFRNFFLHSAQVTAPVPPTPTALPSPRAASPLAASDPAPSPSQKLKRTPTFASGTHEIPRPSPSKDEKEEDKGKNREPASPAKEKLLSRSFSILPSAFTSLRGSPRKVRLYSVYFRLLLCDATREAHDSPHLSPLQIDVLLTRPRVGNRAATSDQLDAAAHGEDQAIGECRRAPQRRQQVAVDGRDDPHDSAPPRSHAAGAQPHRGELYVHIPSSRTC